MISVVTSTYNRSDRLKRAIESVLNQTFVDWEMVVVDDCSTDDTKEVVSSFKDPRIRYIRLEKNFGNDTKPKNEGIKASKGEFVAFLDDDNVYRPDHLAVLIKEINRHPAVDVAYGDRWIVDEENRIKPMIGKFLDFSPFVLMRENYIDTSDVLIRRQALFDVGGFDEAQKKYVDWNLWVRLAKFGKSFRRVPVVITDYHLHMKMKSETVKLAGEENGEHRPAWDAVNCKIEVPYLKEVKPPRVAVYSLTYDRLEYTKICFESLYRTAGYKFDHFIVDNGSKDGTVKWLKDFYPKATVIANEKNKGISVASNQAVDAIVKEGYDIIMKVDNDCLFLVDGWLAKMVEIWETNRNLALSCYVQGLRDNPGGAPRLFRGMVCGELIGMTKHLGGICHFVDTRGYKDFRWDENSFLHGMQDAELSQHLLNNNFQMGYLENWYCEHFEGTDGQHSRYPEYFERRKLEKTTRYEPSK